MKMQKKNYFKKATDPLQYDSVDVNWEKEGLQKSPTRQFIQEYLREALQVGGKSVFDVGSGMGQLFRLFRELGAANIAGIEPSKNSIIASRRIYPDIEVFHGVLEEMPEDKAYDVITVVMVFEHIENVRSAFKKLFGLLSRGGMMYVVVANDTYFRTPRFDYKIEIEELGNEEAVVKSERSIGTLYDIVRPLEHYISEARHAGFKIPRHIEMKPTPQFLKLEPRYKRFSNLALEHLLILQK